MSPVDPSEEHVVFDILHFAPVADPPLHVLTKPTTQSQLYLLHINKVASKQLEQIINIQRNLKQES